MSLTVAKDGQAKAEQWAAFGSPRWLLAGRYDHASDFADTPLDIADQTGSVKTVEATPSRTFQKTRRPLTHRDDTSVPWLPKH